MAEKKIFFMHMPKCAGSSIYDLFSSHYKVLGFAETFLPDIAALREATGEIDFVGGHIRIHDMMQIVGSDPNYRCFTIMRDPVEQLASHLCWIKRYNLDERRNDYGQLDLFTRRLVDELKPVDFADPGHLDHFLTHLPAKGLIYFDNMQSRYLLNEHRSEWKEWQPVTLNLTHHILENLSRFEFVGHMSRPERTLEMVRSRFFPQSDAISLPVTNVNTLEEKIDTGNPMIVDVLKKRLNVDLWLSREILHRIDNSQY